MFSWFRRRVDASPKIGQSDFAPHSRHVWKVELSTVIFGNDPDNGRIFAEYTTKFGNDPEKFAHQLLDLVPDWSDVKPDLFINVKFSQTRVGGLFVYDQMFHAHVWDYFGNSHALEQLIDAGKTLQDLSQ